MKVLKWFALSIGGVAVVLVAVLLWAIATRSGSRWTVEMASYALGARLEIKHVDGTIAGPLELAGVQYLNPDSGVTVSVNRIELDLGMRDLARLVVRVQSLTVDGVDVLLYVPEETAPQPVEAPRPFSLEPPIDIVVDALAIGNAIVRRGDAPVLEVTRATFAGRWTENELAIEQLDVRSPQGEVTFAGRLAQPDDYVGQGAGRFRWRLGERTLAGAITSDARADEATVRVDLSAPLPGELELVVRQNERWPWRFTFDTPRFDPREGLLPDSGLESLAVSLSGEGELERGAVKGRVVIDDEPLIIDALRFARRAERLELDAVLRVGDSPGKLEAQASLDPSAEPLDAAVQASWGELALPAVWTGQDLRTRGRIEARGNPEKFNANGALSIGPPGRVADLVLDVNGEPGAVELKRFDIVQPRGKLAANGKVLYRPRVAWNIAANARRFDPGAFAAAWPGSLSFDLESEGRITTDGPAGALTLKNVGGELRERPISGSADVAITPALVPSGSLVLRSGESELRFRGKPGDWIDANVALAVPSLTDWLPDASGELRGAFIVRGRWPELSIEGDARGRELAMANARIADLRLEARVQNPRDPSGAAQLELTTLSAAGFEFASVRARASGDGAAHTLELQADGRPLALELALEGARLDSGWSGVVKTLVFDLENAARLALRAPVQVTAKEGALEASRACFADGAIELCASGGSKPDGALRVDYSLANVPLALADAFTGGDMPLKFAGELGGRGDVRRTPEGEWLGNARIESRSGEVSRVVTPAAGDSPGEPQSLLTWRDLAITADLAGTNARASVNARIAEDGFIEGEASVSGLDAAESPVTGRLAASLPDLAPLAVFAPQLANVRGRADARFDVGGALQAPELSGELSATELAADVPAIGLHLTDGRLIAQPSSTREITVKGGVRSGDGTLAFEGVATTDGVLDLNINGERFLAADIPGARVLITPDLNFARADERMKLTGMVTIPEAAIDVQKLPRGGDRARQASPDVVVIDAQEREEQAEAAPLFADVTVVLGEDVQLVGFGLQAKVQGRLDVRERPGEPTSGSGEVRVAGAYKAYGQDLTIRQGQLLYAGTPLDNPRLNIEATRQVEEVTAGLRVRGTAQSPELTVFSDPAMGQADALSYLVAGKPLDDIGSSEAEGDALQAATRSLGTAAGGLLAKNLGRRLGIGDVGVQDEEMLGGSALTVGRYLSPRLYLSYGVGLFEPGEIVTLRYKLSPTLDVKAQRGPEDVQAGLEYRIER